MDDCIRRLDEPDEDFPLSEEDRRLVAALSKRLLDSHLRLQLDQIPFDDLERSLSSAGLLEWNLDDQYTRRMIAQVPKMVRRTLRLGPLAVAKTPTEEMNVYVGEATRCYIFGLWQASVALSRAALEQALRDRLQDSVSASAKLTDLLNAAQRCGVLDDTHLSLAVSVQEAGNRVLHREPVTQAVSEDVLISVRGVLLHLYHDGA